MDFVPLGTDADSRQMNELASLFDAPAYIRRARNVHARFSQFLHSCAQKREELIQIPRLRVGTLHALAGSFVALSPWLACSEEVVLLEGLHDQLSPQLRLPPKLTNSPRLLQKTLRQLVGCLERFNGRWLDFIEKLDLDLINDLREGYNRYYVVEKSCAIRSDLLARHGFSPLPVLDTAEILHHFPLLAVPRLKVE